MYIYREKRTQKLPIPGEELDKMIWPKCHCGIVTSNKLETASPKRKVKLEECYVE